MKTYRNFWKANFVMKNFYRDQFELIRVFGINLVLWLNKKWPVDNIIEPHISGYKLLNERTSGILKVFDFHNKKANFPENFWYNENFNCWWLKCIFLSYYCYSAYGWLSE